MRTTNGEEIDGLKIRVDYIEKGICKTEQQLNTRLEGMNEFRESLKDAQGTFLTRNEYDVKHMQLQEKIEANQQIIYLKVEALTKIVYITVGTLAVLEIILRFLLK